jgi:hypothetical protein
VAYKTFRILFVWKWTQALHPFPDIVQCLETELPIQAMSIVGGEQPAADVAQVGMFEHGLHQPLAQTMSTKIFMNEDIAEIGDDGVIGHNPRHADLSTALIDAEDERVGECRIGVFARAGLCPVGAGQKIIHGVHIQSGWVRADGELITMYFHYLRHAASLSHHGIIPEIHVIASRALRRSNPTIWRLLRAGPRYGREKHSPYSTTSPRNDIIKIMEKNVQTYSLEYLPS